MSERELADLRRDYAAGGLSEADLDPDPVVMLRRWLEDARAARLHEPNAMVLATATEDGVPSARVVLLKGLDQDGLVFFTNRGSRKGLELERNPSCALVLPWHDLERQVRVEGVAGRLTPAEDAAYFARRPRDSQLGAWASRQSEVVDSRARLEEELTAAEQRFAEDQVPVPPFWGGYRVAPESVELWQGRHGRLHDRLRYRRAGAGWVVDRLSP